MRCIWKTDDFHTCGSYAFNLHQQWIKQETLCDVHYWQAMAVKAEARVAELEEAKTRIQEALGNGVDEAAWAPGQSWVDAACDAITFHRLLPND
jgi:hypothetical protein